MCRDFGKDFRVGRTKVDEKEVYLTIKSVQSDDDDQDTIELFTIGKMSGTDGKYTFKYNESKATGFEGSHVTLNVESDSLITLIRSGKSSANLIIEKGKKHHCHYNSEYGYGFMMGISADEVRNELSDEGGDLYFKYTIDINSSFVSVNELFVNVKAIKEAEKLAMVTD